MICTDLAHGIIGAIPATISAGLGYFPGNSSLTCLYHSTFIYVLASASCTTLLAVTVERYVSVAHPLRYPLVVTVRRSRIVVELIWLLHGLLAVILISVVPPQYDNIGRFDPDYLTCFDRQKITVEFFYYIALFEIIPCFSIVFIYSRMLMIAHQNKFCWYQTSDIKEV